MSSHAPAPPAGSLVHARRKKRTLHAVVTTAAERKNYITMRFFVLILLLILPSTLAAAQTPPSSPRSREAIARQRGPLQRQLAARDFKWGAPLFIRIFKAERILEVWLKKPSGYEHFKSFPICTYGGKGLGPKLRQGDGQAPEGFYFVTPNRMNPFSRFHLAFNLGYPNPYDRARGRTGSALMVHGSCVSIGCFAMTDHAMETIYTLADAALRYGQPFFRVHIFPFRMNQRNMQHHCKSPWIGFWRNLKDGYDWFDEHHHTPPNVVLGKGRYCFERSNEI
jgi:murein L,D-transpeptidase YafK